MTAGQFRPRKLMFAARNFTLAPTQPHALSTFLQQDLDELASEYTRIYERTIEDPGTAGDEGEENWADLLREWLPNGYKVVTKGRIIGVTGEASQQIDVLVLNPAYPTRLLRKKLYLANGVAAAFECKTTLKPSHLKKAAETAATVQRLAGMRTGSPYRELMGSPMYGVLAHSHTWQRPQSKPRDNLQRALWNINIGATHPVDLPDLICVADVGCWKLAVHTNDRTTSDAEGQLGESSMLVQTTYMSWHESSGQPPPNPVAVAITALLGRLGWEDVSIQPLADYFRLADLIGQEQGQMRAWRASEVYTPNTAAIVEGEVTAQGGTLRQRKPWNEWSRVLL